LPALDVGLLILGATSCEEDADVDVEERLTSFFSVGFQT
jgi:hypothetical protein